MAIPKHAKRDKNEPEIIEALVKAGAFVVRLNIHNVPDTVIGYHGHTFLAEIKSGKNKLREGQLEFQSNWQGSKIYLIRTIEDVFQMLSENA